MIPSFWLWIRFALFALAMLALDLGMFHGTSQDVGTGAFASPSTGADAEAHACALNLALLGCGCMVLSR